MSVRTIPYYRPQLDAAEVEAVVNSMRNGWLTTGPKVQEFETSFARAAGSKHAIALNSCTAALHLGLAALGVGPGDEVVMPSLTFVAGAQCARHLGATPVFADVDPLSLCVTPETLKPVVTAKTKVIMPMHYGGAPLDIDGIVTYAHSRGIKVVEDAAHAGGTLDPRGRWAGAVSDAACYSFYATKNITTAEGGMFVTNDDDLAHAVRILSLHGMDKDAWKRYTLGSKYSYDVVAVGYKYNMPDMAAALGLVQLAKLPAMQSQRDALAHYYLDELSRLPGLRAVGAPPEAPGRHSWCVFAVIVEEELGISRDRIIDGLSSKGIGTSVHFMPTHQMSAYRDVAHALLPVSEWSAARLISLPLYPGMSLDDARYVMAALADIVSRARTTRRSEAAVP